MLSDPVGKSETQVVYDLFAKILIIRLVILVLMIIPAAMYQGDEGGGISTSLFCALWALGSGIIFATAIYGLFIELKTGVAAFTYLGISTIGSDESLLGYLLYLLIGVAVALLSGIFTYACIVGAITGR